MIRFAELLDRLVLTPSRNGKIRLLTEYFREAPDPDRGYALAAITGDLSFSSVKPAMLRALISERMDPVLFGYADRCIERPAYKRAIELEASTKL